MSGCRFMFQKMGVLVLLAALMIGSSGCESEKDKKTVTFSNKSSHTVTVYYRNSELILSLTHILKPGESFDAEAMDIQKDQTLYYNWSPRDTVIAQEDGNDITFVEK